MENNIIIKIITNVFKCVLTTVIFLGPAKTMGNSRWYNQVKVCHLKAEII